MRPLKIQLSAGELSADMHGQRLVEALKRLRSETHVYGMGGDNLRTAGMDVRLDFRQFAGVMGFVSVAKKIFTLLSANRQMIQLLDREKPDCLVLIDFPDFNLRLARAAYARGIPVIYFIPPKVWAWRKSRIKLLKKYCDAICYIFPFEEVFFKEAGLLQSHFVGHPFTTEPVFAGQRNANRHQMYAALGLDPEEPTVLCLIGSRKAEIEYHFPVVLDTLLALKKKMPRLQAILSRASTVTVPFRIPAEHRDWIVTSDHSSRELMMNTDVGIIKSGTSTLEAAFAKLPSVYLYKAGAVSVWLVKQLLSLPAATLPNLIVPGTATELIQDECTVEALQNEVLNLFTTEGRAAAEQALSQVIAACARSGTGINETETMKQSAYDKVADIIVQRTGRS